VADYSIGTAKGRLIIDYDDKGLKIAADDFERVDGKARKASSGVAEAGTKMALAGGIIAAGLGLAAKTAIDFEKQISAIGAVSGATKGELEALRKKALQIGTDTAFGATEAALAMEELAKAGISVKDIMAGAADATVALAAAGGVELPAAAELAADAMNAFQLSASQMPKIADLIAGAANSSSISVGDFAQSLKQVGAVAKLAGVDFNDTATAIALLGKVGIKGSDAGTSLKTMFMNLQPVTKKQIDLFKELGIVTANGSNQFFTQEGKLKSLAQVSEVLHNATKDMTQQQKLLTLETVFGSDAIRAAATLTDAGAAGFDNMAAAMAKVTAEEVAAARLDNTAGAIERLKGSAETAAIAFGTLLLPALTKVVNFLAKVADFLNGLSDGTKNVIINVALMTSGLLLFLGLAVKIFQFAKAVQTMVVAIKALALWSKIARAATIAWTAVQWLLNAALTANPIGLVIVAIAALIAGIILLWKHSETFRKIVMTVWEAIKTAALAVVNWFREDALPILKAVWQQIQTVFQNAWKVISFILNVLTANIQLAVKVITSVVKFLAPIFKSAFGLIVSIVKTAISIISALFEVWRTVAGAIFGPVLRAIVALFKWAFGFIKGQVTQALTVIMAVWNAIVAFLGPILQWIADKVTWAFNTFLSIVKSVLNFLQPFVSAAVKFIAGVIEKVWNVITTVTSAVWNALVLFFTTIWNAIVAIFQAAVDRVVAVINGIKAFVDKIRSFFNELKTAAQGGTDSLIAFVKGIPGRILDAIGNLAGLLFAKGKDLVQGLIDGILSMIGKLKDAAKKLVDAVGRFLPGSPAKEGPLSGKGYVLKRGQRFVADFASGILGAAKAAKDAMGGMINTAVQMLPVDQAATVGSAVANLAPVPITPASAQASTNDSSITIENFTIEGTWDLADPNIPRVFVARLHESLDRYAKEHR
jgi:TP901 family phage tail tape measure protein